jgi:hypothetical protein
MPLRKTIDGCKLVPFVGLCLALGTPFAARLLHLGTPPEQAMQSLAVWPSWHKLSLPQYFTDLDQWIEHHYPLRLEVIRYHSYVKHRWLKAPANAVIVGDGGWLFYTGNRTTEDMLGQDRFSAAELEHWVQAVRGRRAWLKQHGASHLLVIAPNKSTIYPEALPTLLQLQRKPGKLDQLLAALHQAGLGDDAVVDLRPRLLAEKTRHICYWPTDSHWNAEGLLAASDEIMGRLVALNLVKLHPAYRALYQIEHIKREGDCVGILAMNGHWPAFDFSQVYILPTADSRISKTTLSEVPRLANVSIPPWAQPVAFERDSGQGRLVLLCDSFFRVGGLAPACLGLPPLSIHFKRFVSVWDWNDADNLADFPTLAEIVTREHPDIVIEQFTERYLRTPPPDHPEFQKFLSH